MAEMYIVCAGEGAFVLGLEDAIVAMVWIPLSITWVNPVG